MQSSFAPIVSRRPDDLKTVYSMTPGLSTESICSPATPNYIQDERHCSPQLLVSRYSAVNLGGTKSPVSPSSVHPS